jgi:hypothetical protein
MWVVVLGLEHSLLLGLGLRGGAKFGSTVHGAAGCGQTLLVDAFEAPGGDLDGPVLVEAVAEEHADPGLRAGSAAAAGCRRRSPLRMRSGPRAGGPAPAPLLAPPGYRSWRRHAGWPGRRRHLGRRTPAARILAGPCGPSAPACSRPMRPLSGFRCAAGRGRADQPAPAAPPPLWPASRWWRSSAEARRCSVGPTKTRPSGPGSANVFKWCLAQVSAMSAARPSALGPVFWSL